MMKPTHRRRAALAATTLFLLAACGQADVAGDTPAAAPTALADAPGGHDAHGGEDAHGGDDVHGGEDAHGGHDADAENAPLPGDAEEVVRVSMVDIAFEPATIEITAGEPVTLVVSNDGLLEHDLDLPAADLHVHGYPGDERTALLQIDTPGTYEARCLISGHADAGMIMKVVVT